MKLSRAWCPKAAVWLLGFGLCFGGAPAALAHSSGDSMKVMQADLKGLQNDITATEMAREKTGGKISSIKDEITELENSRENQQKKIEEKQAEVAELDEKVSDKIQVVCEALKALYKSGEFSQISVILQCDDVDELLTMCDMVQKLNKNLSEEVADLKALCAQRKADQAQLEKLRVQLDKDLEEKRGELERLESKKAELAETLKNLHQQISELSEKIAKASTKKTGKIGQISNGIPVSGRISDTFGSRRGTHKGVDIAAPKGTTVRAAGKGKVISAGRKGGYGNCIDIDHGSGVTTRYAHLNDICVKVGQGVERGEPLGGVGNTGMSFGNHLHFELRKDNVPVDPMGMVQN